MLPDYPLTIEEAHAFFGPVIDETFQKYASTESEVNELVKCYRKYNEEVEGLIEELKGLGIKALASANCSRS